MDSSLNRGMTDGDQTPSLTDELANLKNSYSQLRKDVTNLFTQLVGARRGGADAARGSATDAMENLKTQLSDLKDKSADQMQFVQKRIEEHPVSSTLIAFGVGFIVAKFFGNRD